MCGIAGIVDQRGRAVNAEQLHDMISAIAHRGPDGRGVWTDHAAGLGHCRLSIIDVAGGQQPMSTSDGRFWITYNGEIFNYLELREELIGKGHQFASRSDTEVILHLYQEEGEDCVQRMNGQWAFAIWDRQSRKLFASRDRLGVRPFFYTEAQGRFLFASEIKALQTCPEVPRELDAQALDQIFTFWTTLPPRTAFRNIRQLPPGHSLMLEDGKLRVTQYWNLEYAPEDESGDEGREAALADELLALLTDATRIRLRADCPVGAYLSGGLDSTLITALTAKLVGDRLRTFSVSFSETEFDESGYQREASAFLRTQHSEIRCLPGSIGQIFPDVVSHVEQPILRTAPAPLFLLARLVRESGFKVVLTGEGADEMFGGYDIFAEAKIRRFWGGKPESAWRHLLLKRLYPYLDGIQRQSPAYLKRFFQATEQDLAGPFFSHLPRWRLTMKLKNFLSKDFRQQTDPGLAFRELEHGLPPSYHSWHWFNKAEYLEATGLLPGFILSSQGDRVAMAHGVEGRFPFLDYRVVEFAAKLPPRLKMRVLNQKYLLKRAGQGLIPEAIRRRHKQPYRAPDGASFLGREAGYVNDLLSTENIRRSGIFDPAAVTALLAKFRSGRATSTVDNMAFVGILSTEILQQQSLARSAQRSGYVCQEQLAC